MTTRPVRRQYETRNTNRPQSMGGRSSLSDKAIQLLLQKSIAAATLDTATLASQLPTESGLLLDVIDFCQQHHECTIIAILGAWEGTVEGAHLKALAEDATFSPALNVEGELTAILNQLRIQAIQIQLQQPVDLGTRKRLKEECAALIKNTTVKFSEM